MFSRTLKVEIALRALVTTGFCPAIFFARPKWWLDAGQVVVAGDDRRLPLPLGDVEHRLQAVGRRLIGPEDSEVPLREVQLHHVPEELAQNGGVLGIDAAGRLHVHGVVPEIGQAQVAQEQSAVGVGATRGSILATTGPTNR